MSSRLQQQLEQDRALWETLDRIDPLFLIGAAEELTAEARCLQALRQKKSDLQESDRQALV